jgi:mRNA-degrading endonuclease RelE of RelBE toxin-antitoxin system
VEFIEAPLFTQRLPDFLTDEAYRELQEELSRSPEAGDVIPGTGGFRKLRWADSRRRKGKRGGLRLIYYYLLADSQIWLMTVYDKDSVTDLSPAERRLLKAAIERETQERAKRRTGRKK